MDDQHAGKWTIAGGKEHVAPKRFVPSLGVGQVVPFGVAESAVGRREHAANAPATSRTAASAATRRSLAG